MSILRVLLTLFTTFYVTTICVIGQCNTSNLILSNHSFENGFTDWNPRTGNSGNANFNVVNTEATNGTFSAETEVTNLGNNFWDIQVKRNGIALTAGITYVLTFDARKSTGTEDMKYGINTANGNNFVTAGTAQLTDVWQSFTHSFTHGASEDASLFFNYGDILGTFYLDNVNIQEFCPMAQPQASFCKTLSVPGINGIEGGIWTPAIQYDLNQPIEGSAANAGDLSAYYKVIWDKTNLYILVNVTDDNLRNDSPAGLESFDDGIELYLAVGNDKSTTYDGVDDHHFLFRWNDSNIYHLSHGQINPTGAVAKDANTVVNMVDVGYTYEIYCHGL